MGIGCGGDLILDLGATPITVPHVSFDLVYYERENPLGFVALDWVIVEIGTSATGPWIQVFNWGDGVPDNNTNIASYSAGGELDNESIPLTDLYGTPPFQTGVSIDVDGLAGPGSYGWVRISSPLGGSNDPSEVDAIEILP
jgi:hypothetical protein